MKNIYISSSEAAKILGISRIAVFKKIKNKEIKAMKIGRNFAIDKTDLDIFEKKQLNDAAKQEIDKAVKKTVQEYGETLKMLGNA